MKQKNKSILNGIGTIIDIFPSGKYSKYLQDDDSSKSICMYWVNSGSYISDAMVIIGNEEKTEEKTTQKKEDLLASS